ncbi:MAG: glycerophosphoryl diester phosphodiesterase [Verrucomicrobiales bacterium]|nr:glycerophosphoryl diester phosphodiesterase [Verrucomicrobiales bacterium]
MLIIAHRGASHDAPENTMAAFRLAMEQHADGIECDVQMTADWEWVVLHDETTERTGGVDLLVEARTVNELRRVDVGSWKGQQWRGERIPLLSEVLILGRNAGKLLVEIKGEQDVADKFVRFVRLNQNTTPFEVISLSLGMLREIRKTMPEVPTWWVIDFDEPPLECPDLNLDEIIRLAKAAGVSGLDFGANFPWNAEFVERFRLEGMGLGVWTVDSVEEARRFESLKIDFLTTNRPALLKVALAEMAP